MGMMSGQANHLGMGKRPSNSHHWVPGMGWVFMPTFDEGNSFRDQAEGRGSEEWTPVLSAQSTADALASGTNHYVAKSLGIPPELAAKIRARQLSQEWYTGGMDYYNGPVGGDDESWKRAAEEWVNARNGRPTISPWINTFDSDVENTYNRMRMDNYNAFLGREGGWVGDEDVEVTGNSAGYRDDSIAGWFKDQFASNDMAKYRLDAIRTLNGWNSQVRNPNYQSSMDRSARWINGEGNGINKATTRMTEEYFNQMDLANKFGLSWGESGQAQGGRQGSDEQILRDVIAKGNALINGGSANLMRNAARDQGEGAVWTDLNTNVAGQNMGPFMLGQIAKRR